MGEVGWGRRLRVLHEDVGLQLGVEHLLELAALLGRLLQRPRWCVRGACVVVLQRACRGGCGDGCRDACSAYACSAHAACTPRACSIVSPRRACSSRTVSVCSCCNAVSCAPSRRTW